MSSPSVVSVQSDHSVTCFKDVTDTAKTYFHLAAAHKITICGDAMENPTCLCVQHSPPLPYECTLQSISKVTVSTLYYQHVQLLNCMSCATVSQCYVIDLVHNREGQETHVEKQLWPCLLECVLVNGQCVNWNSGHITESQCCQCRSFHAHAWVK